MKISVTAFELGKGSGGSEGFLEGARVCVMCRRGHGEWAVVRRELCSVKWCRRP